MNEKSIVQQYKAVQVELSQLNGEVLCALTEKQNEGGYIYPNAYGGWVQRYNKIVQKVNGLMGASLPERRVLEPELSSSRKTVRIESVKAFVSSIQRLEEAVAKEIRAEESKATSIPGHQMRRCFKTGTRGCPQNPPEEKSRVFVAMPFSDDYKDSYEFGVKIALEQLGMMPYKADENINNKDVMCKICEKIQCCGKVIATFLKDFSDQIDSLFAKNRENLLSKLMCGDV